MKGPIVEQPERKTVGVGPGDLIEEELQEGRVERGQFEKEALASQGFDCAVQMSCGSI